MNIGNVVGSFPSSFVPSLVHRRSAIASSKIGADPRICILPLPKSFLSSSEKLPILFGISDFGKELRSK